MLHNIKFQRLIIIFPTIIIKIKIATTIFLSPFLSKLGKISKQTNFQLKIDFELVNQFVSRNVVTLNSS